MGQKRTAGYERRLSRALNEGPRPMSVRGLSDALNAEGSPYRGIRGSSYGGVRQYVEGAVRSPRIEVLRAMADVLGVRGDWLAFEDGAMTEGEERASATGREARIAVAASFLEEEEERRSKLLRRAIVAELPAMQKARAGTWSRLATLLETWAIEMREPAPTPPPESDVPRMLSRTREETAAVLVRELTAERERAVALAKTVARSVGAAAAAAGVDLRELSPSHLDLYVEATCHALALLIVRPDTMRKD